MVKIKTNLLSVYRFFLFSIILAILIFLVNQETFAWAAQNQPRPATGLAGTGQVLIIENQGQYEAGRRFLLVDQPGYVWLTQDSLWISVPGELKDPSGGKLPDRSPTSARFDRVRPRREVVNLRFSFPGAQPDVKIETFNPLGTRISYFLGNRPQAWHPDVPTWGGARYRDLYPGIDLVIQGRLSGGGWYFEARPGADLSKVNLAVEGADSTSLFNGRLQVQTRLGGFELPLPQLKQPDLIPSPESQLTQNRDGSWMIDSPFAPADQSHPQLAQPDNPEDLIWSTFLGGGDSETGNGIDIDADNEVYLTGETYSADFPLTPGVVDQTFAQSEAYVAKLSADGTTLLYATFLGGNDLDAGWNLAVDNQKVYLIGDTSSTDFPGTAGSNGESDAFVVGLNDTGTALIYSILLGGSDQDTGYGIYREANTSFITGVTWSRDFPASGYKGNSDVFIARLDDSGNSLYKTLIGGKGDEAGFSVAASGGNAFVTGETASSDFPGGGAAGSVDAFVIKITPVGALANSKRIGGISWDRGNDIAVDAAGNQYITGFTQSSDFPVDEGSFGGGSYDAILVKYDSSGNKLYSTFLGGSATEEGLSLDLDQIDGIYVIGRTNSTDFPTTPSAYQGSLAGGYDGFVTRYDLASSDPGHRTYSSYIGGTANDRAQHIAVDLSSHAYLTGYTQSSDFPSTNGAWDSALAGSQDAFLTKLLVGPVPDVVLEKTTNLSDADLPPGPSILVGGSVTWDYHITNTGDLTLSNITLTDDQEGQIACPKTSLNPGEVMICTHTGEASLGQYQNTATISADSTIEPVSDIDQSHYFGAQPAIQLIKRTNGQDANTPPGPYILAGESITWEYEVINSGNVDLGKIQVSDSDPELVITCPAVTLSAGLSMTCSATGIAVAGQYSNTGTVTASPPDGLPAIQDEDLSHYYGLVTRQLSLSVGWTLITLPIEPLTPFDSKTLLEDMDNQGAACTEVYRWQSGAWELYRSGSAGTPFPIEMGRGYFIRCSGYYTWQYQGKELTGSVPLAFSPGWNLVGVPHPPHFYDAQTFLSAINNQGGACTEVYRWQSGAWELYRSGSGGTPFPIEPERGYFVRCTSSSTFTP